MHNKKIDTNKSRNIIQGLRPFSSSVPQGLKKKLRKGSYNYSNIIDNWTKIIGKELSAICYPNSIKASNKIDSGVLLINVIHGNELNVEYSKQEIIDRVNDFFGYKYVKEVRLKIVQEKIVKKNKSLFNQKNNKQFVKELINIQDNNLKNSLEKLIEAFNEKNK